MDSGSTKGIQQKQNTKQTQNKHDMSNQFAPVNTSNQTHYAASFLFNNGYGASVVCHPGSYGGRGGLFEVAITRGDKLHYRPDFYNGDVAGNLTFGEVEECLRTIASYPSVASEA